MNKASELLEDISRRERELNEKINACNDPIELLPLNMALGMVRSEYVMMLACVDKDIIV
jgi:hypothetical protein